jgi:C4-dicarboxylate-binding protein DctP
MITRASTIAALLLLVASALPAHAAKYKIRWYVGHRNLDYFEDAARDFKTRVETASKGDIEVQIVQETSAGAPQGGQIPAAVAKGEAEMGHSFTDVIGDLDPKFYAFEAPYLFRDYRHLEGVFEGPLGASLLDGLKDKKLEGLAFTYSGGASGVATASREIRKPSDLKGLKVGVYGDAVNEAWLSALGATPVKIQHDLDAIVPMLREGKLDAVAITWRNFEVGGLEKGFKYFALPGSTYLVSVTYVNDAFFASLPRDYQRLLKTASHDLARIERARTVGLNEAARRSMASKGVEALYQTSASRAEFEKAVRPAYASIDRVVGHDLIERLRKTADGPDFPRTSSLASASR